jgi:acyl carrier protein
LPEACRQKGAKLLILILILLLLLLYLGRTACTKEIKIKIKRVQQRSEMHPPFSALEGACQAGSGSYSCLLFMEAPERLIQELKTKIIAGFHLEGITPGDIQGDAPIFGTGLGLDSIDALELVAIVEEDYGVIIQERQVADQAFASVRTLAEFITAHQSR